jgi:hypothetical protein
VDTSDSGEAHAAGTPQRHVYYVTVEWLDQPHGAELPERLAHMLRQALEHAHNVPPDAPPARFIVRVRMDTTTSEVSGTVVHHHHHHA